MAAVVGAEGGCVLAIRVVPGASRPGVVGLHGDEVRVRVASPPEGGRANAELCAVLAGLLGVRASAVAVVSGSTSRSKRVFAPVPVGKALDALGIGRSGPVDR